LLPKSGILALAAAWFFLSPRVHQPRVKMMGMALDRFVHEICCYQKELPALLQADYVAENWANAIVDLRSEPKKKRRKLTTIEDELRYLVAACPPTSPFDGSAAELPNVTKDDVDRVLFDRFTFDRHGLSSRPLTRTEKRWREIEPDGVPEYMRLFRAARVEQKSDPKVVLLLDALLETWRAFLRVVREAGIQGEEFVAEADAEELADAVDRLWPFLNEPAGATGPAAASILPPAPPGDAAPAAVVDHGPAKKRSGGREPYRDVLRHLIAKCDAEGGWTDAKIAAKHNQQFSLRPAATARTVAVQRCRMKREQSNKNQVA
jgi:hypothetical protein